MKVLLPDGNPLELPDGATGADAARAIGTGLARAALGIRVTENGSGPELRDLSAPLADGAGIEIVTAKTPENGQGPLWLIRHDAAHVLATAVTELYPGVKVSIGPPIEDGFYYDFEFPEGVSVSEHDLERIEERMREHVKADEAFERAELPAAEAIERFRGEGQDYKVELIEDLVRDQGVDTVSLYRNGPFTDLCRGPHGPSTKRIEAFKLTSVAGAYWRGDSSRKMLTRIYGTAFLSKADLEEHLKRLEEARARDHRKLGRELGLFMLSDVAPGMPFWLPKGTHIWNELTRLWRTSNVERGYTEVRTPILYDVELWKKSGPLARLPRPHVLHGRRGPADGPEADELPGPRPDLQARARAPTATSRSATPSRGWCTATSRAERSTACCGCGTSPRTTRTCSAPRSRSRRRCCAASTSASSSTTSSASSRGSSCPRAPRSGWAPRRCGTGPRTRSSGALESRGLEYDLNEGDGAFYGPKIDLHMTDTIGRSWQLGTVQLDYYMPEQFELTYTGADNAEHRPAMIHRALMGSFERFIGILIEHYAGEFPLWLAPVQAIVLPIADRHVPYARAGGRRAAPARVCGRGRRPHRVGRPEDPRRGAAEGALHARGGRQGGGRRQGGGPPPPRGRPRRRCR